MDLPKVSTKPELKNTERASNSNLGLEDKLYTKVGSLSGGQRQALALLMSTMTPIEFLILDEHTAALDPKTAELLWSLRTKLCVRRRLRQLW